MPVSPTSPQGTQVVLVVLLAIIAWLCVAYWRNTLRIILAVLIAFAIYGAVVGIEGVTSLMASHHRESGFSPAVPMRSRGPGTAVTVEHRTGTKQNTQVARLFCSN